LIGPEEDIGCIAGYTIDRRSQRVFRNEPVGNMAGSSVDCDRLSDEKGSEKRQDES